MNVLLNKQLNKQTRGFTIVELLIVIVVISILAAISIVAYNGIQARATDSRMRTAASQVVKAIRLFNIDTGKQLYSGSGSTGPTSNDACPGASGVSGWFSSGKYNCTAEDLLIANGNLPADFSSTLPVNKVFGNSSKNTFMLYSCGTNKYVLEYYLEAPTQEDIAGHAQMRSDCSRGTTTYSSYNMRAVKIFELN